MTDQRTSLARRAPALHAALVGNAAWGDVDAASIERRQVMIAMRDGICLATDLYFPRTLPAPVILLRTPYGRAAARDMLLRFARDGYVVAAQDCRGTGDSEPGRWDYYVFEKEDSYDFVEWAVAQSWNAGWIGGFGGSYQAETQWCMAMHPSMSAIAPEVGGLGVAYRTLGKHLFYNAYASTVGKGSANAALPLDIVERDMHEETWATGFFNALFTDAPPARLTGLYPSFAGLPRAEWQRALWERYCAMPAAARADLLRALCGTDALTIVDIESLTSIFGQHIAHDAHMFAELTPERLAGNLHAPALMISGWYDWSLNDVPATWAVLQSAGQPVVASRSRLILTPSAHNAPGYHEGAAQCAELTKIFRGPTMYSLLLAWFEHNRNGNGNRWPRITYFLMGANAWHTAESWPPDDAREQVLYLREAGRLLVQPPSTTGHSSSYTYDPLAPTPTLGGSIISSEIRPGSIDIQQLHTRPDGVIFSTDALESDLDVVGPLTLSISVRSSAVDTDFVVRLSDVHPDGRAILIQSGALRARFRDVKHPAALIPGVIYRLKLDLWDTAHRFAAGHRLRIDISSADFPRFNRNSNRGGQAGPPVPADQCILHDADHQSCLTFAAIGSVKP
jgi:predicted acyl esterase